MTENDHRTLIQGACVLTLDPKLGDFEKADILIEGETIRQISPSIGIDSSSDIEVINAQNMIVLPGFVDCHRHMWQTQLRAITADWSLFDYATRIRSVYSSFYDPEDAYVGCYAGFLEAINAGTTTIVDHCHIINSPDHGDEVVRAFKDSGMRGTFCYGLFNNPQPEEEVTDAMFETAGWMFEDARRVRREHFTSEHSLVTMGVALAESEWFPFEFTRRQIDFARELSAKLISTHVGMAALSRHTHFIDRLYRGGLLGPDLLFVHGSALDERDLQLIAEAGASVVGTPETELQMGMGFPVPARIMAHGGSAALGVDIVSNNSGDMFGQMRLNLQVQRGLDNAVLEKKGLAPRVIRLKVRDLLQIATIGGAGAIGLDSTIGSLSPGKQADLITVRTDSINMTPVNDPVASIVLTANAADVDTVMVAGKQLKRDGKLVGVDWPGVADKLTKSRDRIVEGGQRKGFHKSEQIMEQIFPLTPSAAREARLAGRAMRFPFIREPMLRMVMKKIKAKVRSV